MTGLLLAALSMCVESGGILRISTQIDMIVTAYSLECAGCSGIAANGRPPVLGVSVACPASMPLGTWLEIETVGARRCDDRGGRIAGRRIDLFVATRSQALRWGRRSRRVRVLNGPAAHADTVSSHFLLIDDPGQGNKRFNGRIDPTRGAR